MAYRRRQNLSRSSTFKEELLPQPSSISSPPPIDHNNNDSSDNKTSSSSLLPSSSPSLAAQAIKASATSSSRRNPSLSFAFNPSLDHHRSKSFDAFGGKGDSKNGLWGVLAQKAKSMLDDDDNNNNNNNSQLKHGTIPETLNSRSFNNFTDSSAPQTKPSYQYFESNHGRMDNPKFRKGLDKITSSLNQLGDTFEKAFEDGKTLVENKTADLRTQIRRKGSNGSEESNQSSDLKNPWQQQGHTQNQTNRETQLKASRDVAMATAAKAKLLLRELKTVKADLAFAKARCAQLEEENKMLRNRESTDNKGHNREDDDLIRHQLETLLAEKARLASENEIYARENRFLREIVEYHQLTMQDVVYLDEGMEEVTEVYPVDENGVPTMLSMSPHSSSSLSPTSHDEVFLQSQISNMITKDMFPVPEEDSKSPTSEYEDPPHNHSVSKHAK